MNSPTDVKARANKLRAVLSVMGHQLKHSESLEVISKIEGFPDWNTHSAHIAKQQQIVGQYLDEKKADKATAAPDHPIIDAIKSDNRLLLTESLSSDVLSNKKIMSEAFYQSVVLDRLSLAEELITRGADIRSVVIRQRSLFEFVIHTERADYLKMLVFRFKHLKNVHPKSSRVLPLVIDLLDDETDSIEPVKNLLDQGANINAQTRQGDTAVILAGWVRNDLKLVAHLVERGADVNIANNNGDTPLIDAANKGYIEILEYLLKNGADTNHENKMGFSALDMARHRKNSVAIKILEERSKGSE